MASPLPVRHIRSALQANFATAIDFSDQPRLSLTVDQPESAALTRALAALTVLHLSGCSTAEAGDAVIDGEDDFGIDAVRVDPTGSRLLLVQSKWREKGNATLGSDATLRLKEGLDKLLNEQFEEFNTRFQQKWPEISKALDNPAVEITLAIALLGDDPVHDRQREQLDELQRSLDPVRLDVRYLHLSDFHKIVQSGIDRPRVDLQVLVDRCNQHDGEGPFDAFFGTVSVGQVATWYAEHGDRIFDPNIRKTLGMTGINRELVATLRDRPEHFWYFNNGITVVAEQVVRGPKYSGTPGGSGDLTVTGAGIVNGAQTVWAVHRAVQENPEIAEKGVVAVRFIGCPEDFGRQVTTATNTQNRVEERDFAALDEVQLELSRRFPLEVPRKTYTIKRTGYGLPSREAGCDIEEAALALACAQRHPQLLARLRQDQGVLWRPEGEPGSTLLYRRLFGNAPSALRIWRSVLLHRRIDDQVSVLAQSWDSRKAAIVENGRLLIAHLVFQLTDTGEIDDHEADWDGELNNAESRTDVVCALLARCLDARYGPSSYPMPTFRKEGRCQELTTAVLDQWRNGGSAVAQDPQRPAKRPSQGKKPKAVTTLVETRTIEDGTVLEFTPLTGPHQAGSRPWLEANPERRYATWINAPTRPLIWNADGERYAPSNLALQMLHEAMGERAGKAVQGTRYWSVRGRGSLADLAEQERRAQSEPTLPDE